MTQIDKNLTFAPLTNVGLCVSALERATHRTNGLPGIVVFHGPSGYGKSTAATHISLRSQAYCISVQSIWNRKTFLLAILKEMNIVPAKTMPEMAEQIALQLSDSGTPLIIDEAGLLLDREGGANLIKDIYEASQGTLMLIGEEMLPHRIERWERLHGRVLEWVPAQPISQADARQLARIYADGVDIADDLLTYLVDLSKGSVRRVIVNLANILEEAGKVGWQSVDRDTWGKRPLYTGKPPARRG